jgi:hypothetical protein
MTAKQLLSRIKKNAICIYRYGQKRDNMRGKEEIHRFMRGVDSGTKKIAKEIGYTQEKLLKILEDRRGYWALNYYEQYNLKKEIENILQGR